MLIERCIAWVVLLVAIILLLWRREDKRRLTSYGGYEVHQLRDFRGRFMGELVLRSEENDDFFILRLSLNPPMPIEYLQFLIEEAVDERKEKLQTKTRS
jgi:hypothetical protein